MYAHVARQLGDFGKTDLGAHTHGDAIDTLGKCGAQRHFGAGKGAIGISGAPMLEFVFLLVIDQRVDILVEAAGTGHQSPLHRHGIDKELEGGARLVLGAHLIVFPRVKVHIAHPSLDVSVARLHRNESAVHEVQHVAHRVHRAHLHVQRVVLIVEQVHHVRLVHVVVDRVQVVGISSQQLVVDGRVARLVLNKIGDGLVVLIKPAVVVAPVAPEVLLHDLHLLAHGLLGIFLHLGIERGVDLEAVTLQVEFQALSRGDSLDLACHSFTEVGGHTVVVGLEGIFQVDGQRGHRVILSLGQVATFNHVLQYLVAAPQAVLGVDARVIGAGGLEQAHEHSALLELEVTRCGLEIGIGGSLDAVGIAAEVHRIGIHLQDFLLGIEDFQLGGDDPLLALHDEHFHARNIAQQACRVVAAGAEHVLHQLLGDGARATGTSVQHHVLESGTQAAKVDAVMLIEALVLGVDKDLEELRVDRFISHGRAVLVIVLADGLAVGTVQVASLGVAGMHDAVGAGRLAEEPQQVDVHSNEVEEEQHDERAQCGQRLDPPRAAAVQALVPHFEAVPVAGDDIS